MGNLETDEGLNDLDGKQSTRSAAIIRVTACEGNVAQTVFLASHAATRYLHQRCKVKSVFVSQNSASLLLK